ncbi:uncharacterized protein K452DRAFT_23640 [Aplosporella prunicola CBS 121167]|uniref:G-protein coupled receptors family 2 profile 2 domain-containing protein n=1 Tax=Aplosporella prunicola CBS 121167 TaxID=1176127 RepID=A0A6A6BCK1_9PEZI|nr:uncharacterized protein K452DRAFT_23640 [Aplosporella prunicola CBS 121167]KAF2141942.1 hypothetical protein K452DRAFT_23640 [Aplosporella prunicola CBS 121167]
MVELTREDRNIETLERTTSAISLVGTFWILLTFAAFPAFRKPINRLVAYACIGNVCSNIATVLSVTSFPELGGSIALCRFQGFFIQMFMPADALWTMCMAINVYLTFFHNYNANDLRKLEYRYIAICYGIPFVPSLVYLIIDETSSIDIYGPAILWCWVAKRWGWMRMAFFYGPVWCIIFTTVFIYLITGRVIFEQRRTLRDIARKNADPFNISTTASEAARACAENTTTRHPHGMDPAAYALADMKRDVVSAAQSASTASASSRRSSSFSSGRSLHPAAPAPCLQPPRNNSLSSMSITAIPTSHSSTQLRPLPAAECTGEPPPLPPLLSAELLGDLEGPPQFGRTRTWGSEGGFTGGRTLPCASDAAWSYAKVAFIFFVSMFIVWVPSTVNRVWQLVHPDEPNHSLRAAASAVLPLQGAWNAAIYTCTSWSQCCDAAVIIWRGAGARWHRWREGVREVPEKRWQLQKVKSGGAGSAWGAGACGTGAGGGLGGVEMSLQEAEEAAAASPDEPARRRPTVPSGVAVAAAATLRADAETQQKWGVCFDGPDVEGFRAGEARVGWRGGVAGRGGDVLLGGGSVGASERQAQVRVGVAMPGGGGGGEGVVEEEERGEERREDVR